MTKKEFLTAATAAARAASAISGFIPGVTVAQAALESGWGNSLLARTAHNYFGIKARKGRPSVAMPTWEFSNGSRVRLTARFAKYASMEECFVDRDRMIATLSHYAQARSCARDPEAFVRALAKRWATDPRYPEKLLKLYCDYHLDELDQDFRDQPSSSRS